MRLAILALSGLCLLAACSKPTEPAADEAKPQGREETRGIRNTEAIGYSGNAIADKVDTVIETNEQRMDQLNKAVEASE
ncbi:hypothetical protein D0B54_07980 [Solimonas sp. K1W22B-7]|uniref:hypothetical protein n=1 Tax=Solimonas sp. K1W22B-7 TaxID=2303331 RepID=UPI000E336B23|nr:hypothetical protein [Solimonas sp. K1W22B-7]AXQ28622.1 hypothetical protein D0B54_07980 [Solimonas sp. K1W22B-7]